MSIAVFTNSRLRYFLKYIFIIFIFLKHPFLYADDSSGVNFRYGNLQSKTGFFSRFYPQDPTLEEQGNTSYGFELSTLYQVSFVDGSKFNFLPYLKTNMEDSDFNYMDIRELNWKTKKGNWDFSVGFDTVSWWTTESQHLVDIINQVDLREYPDGEVKLGQPLINAEYFFGNQSLSLFILTGFRERPFPGIKSRLRPGIPVDINNPVYEDADQQYHIDYATRYSLTAGNFDLGLSYFNGTSREPTLLPVSNSQNDTVLQPFYAQIDQIGVDASYVLDAWILKLEMIQRNGQLNSSTQKEDYLAYTAGFEYDASFLSSGSEISMFVEYLFDDRDELSTTGLQNDIFIGSRIGFNNTAGASILVAIYQDLSNNGRVFFMENEQRITSRLKLFTTAYFFSNLEPSDPFYTFRKDDFIELSLLFYF